MLKITNYSDTSVKIDNRTILPGSFIVVDYVTDIFNLNKLVNQRKITVVNTTVKSNITNTIDVQESQIKESMIKRFDEDISNNTDINITTKKKKSKDNSEVENSKSTKGDMNNATD